MNFAEIKAQVRSQIFLLPLCKKYGIIEWNFNFNLLFWLLNLLQQLSLLALFQVLRFSCAFIWGIFQCLCRIIFALNLLVIRNVCWTIVFLIPVELFLLLRLRLKFHRLARLVPWTVVFSPKPSRWNELVAIQNFFLFVRRVGTNFF